MEKQTILVIDDEKSTHVMLKAMLGKDYNLMFANSAQEGIDLAAENSINLVLLDIQMPELSGIELLESIMTDTVMRSIPVIVMTGKATEDIEEEARDIGAADFVSKEFLFSNKDEFKEKLDEHLLDKAKQSKHSDRYKQDFRTIIKKIQTEAVHGDFFSACRKLAVGLMNSFEIDYISFWKIQRSKPSLILSIGDRQPENFGPDELMSERAFRELARTKRPYMTNNPRSEKKGIFADTSKELGLSSEAGIPLFKIDKETFTKNGMVIPGSTPLFGFVILKRNRVFTTKEYKLLSRFVIQCGTILWGLYRKLYSGNA
ncbi:MAG: response regulator [Balneolaceae bacterium]|nr:response regulator [Balneolaceae bacterium]